MFVQAGFVSSHHDGEECISNFDLSKSYEVCVPVLPRFVGSLGYARDDTYNSIT